MLTKRQNLIETIKGGKPDRFVDQYDPFVLLMGNPYMKKNFGVRTGNTVVNSWGVTIQF